VIVYNSDQAIAEVVAQELDAEREDIQFQPNPGGDADILVFLGPDYDPCAAK
jgi:Ni,Fe-hydrogenase III small subunit